MKMYSGREVKDIIEDFLAEYFNFDYVCLNADYLKTLQDVLKRYGVEVDDRKENEP